MNRDTITRVLLRHLGDTGPTSPYYTATTCNDAINAAQLRLNRDSAFNRADMTVALVTGVNEYSLGTHVLELYGVTYGSTRKQLQVTSRSALNRDASGWQGATAGLPSKYYTDGMKLGVYPKPNATAAATTLRVHYLRSPDALANGTSVPSWLPVDFHETIAKAAAIDLSGGFNAAGDGSNERIAKLYQDYLVDKQQLAGMAIQRSREYRATLQPTGYQQFRRRPA